MKRLLTAAALAMLAGMPAGSQWKVPWGYTGPRGPEHWAELDPSYAACNGKQQSPIDIHGAVKANLPPLHFDYKTEPLKYLINNGYTIRVNYRMNDHAPPGEGSALVLGGQRYQLTQLHFHRPSEETIDGKRASMVLHLMHTSTSGKVVGVAVLLREGKPNATVQQIWNNMPMVKGDEHEVPGVAIDPAGMLPSTLAYYSYMGSVTAPPCTEGVQWIVLKTPVEVSPEQVAAFAKLYPHDVRPTQPLNGRVIQESE
jgi:carbonic anhydrase